MTDKLAKTNQSVEKALQIIETMANSKEPLRLQEIAQQTGLPASTALRLVNTLLTYGYVNQEKLTLRYSLSLKFAQIGTQVSSHVSLRDLARPLLTELAVQCGESCCLAVRQDNEVVYVDVVEYPGSLLRVYQRIGARAPMYCTAVGKLLLLNLDDESLAQYVAAVGLPYRTPNTIVSQRRLEVELRQVRNQGYAFDNEECEQGARCVAGAIRDYSGKIIAAISVSGPSTRMSVEQMRFISRNVAECASKISRLMAYQE